MLSPHGETTDRGRPAVPTRVLIDNVTLAFAAVFHAISRGTEDCAEQAIVGTPLRMIAYRVRLADNSETLHFEVRSRRSWAEDREPVPPASSQPANELTT